MMDELYWIGPRQSDIDYTNHLFEGSVTIFGDGKNGNIAFSQQYNRINHNIANELCDDFIKNQLVNLIKKNPDIKFLFYNPEQAFRYGEVVEAHSIGNNEMWLLESLSNKAKCRFILSDIVNVIPYVTLKGADCNYHNLCNYFTGDEFVIQKIFSSGGNSTYHITPNNKQTLKEILANKNENYMLSPFLSNSVSINIHAIIAESKIQLFPASIQIICNREDKFLYSGADYICFRRLSEQVKQNVNEDTLKIASLLQKRGYRGVVGLDFLLHEHKLYFVEINPRFQASSDLINRSLSQKYKTSLQKLHLMAFEDTLSEEDFLLSVDYSNFVYTSDNISLQRLSKVIRSNEIFHKQFDGYNLCKKEYENKDVYLGRCVFDKNICTINNDNILLHPNIFTEEIAPYIISHAHSQKEKVKFALLNHGVSLSEMALLWTKKHGIIKEAVFDAIDITIFDHIKVNVPFSCKFNSISPFTIDLIENELYLLLDQKIITKVQIDLILPQLINKKTTSGIPFSAIYHFATDRIRINPAPVCIYKINNKPCLFCNLPEGNYKYSLKDIKEVIDYCLEYIDFRHFLIGGGTYSLEGGWEIIRQIAQYIRGKCNKDIYLMAIPPKDTSILDALKEAGITEVAFNLEIFDRQLAQQIMPGKGRISLEQYNRTFRHAVSLWGNTGKVRSLLIYGFDTDNNFCNGLEDLCRMGVEPIISIFRPLANTLLENENPPATLDIFDIYTKCKRIAEKYSLKLGPDCVECQNNTLSFSE